MRTAMLAVLAVACGSTTFAQGPPADATYFVVEVGFAGPYAWTADCAIFTKTEFCTHSGRCGQWYPTDSPSSEGAFAIAMDFSEWGVPVHVEGQATIDEQGGRHSFSGAGFISTRGTVGNFGFSGRPVSRSRCFRLLGDWDLQHKNPNCLARIEPGDSAGSEYVLPYPIGARSRIKQSYCMMFDSHADDFAYDFELPIGTEVVASRNGVVHVVEDTLPDDPFSERFNFIILEHNGARSTYSHLMQGSAVVDVGDTVEQGQAIARTGLSGSEGVPILHFDVRESFDNGIVGEPVWVDFGNVGGRRDARGGLMRGYKYRALTP